MKYQNILLLLALPLATFAQHFNIHNPIVLPDKSQQAEVRQRIGYTDITIKYHSPGTKGRTIWGKLVPYGKVWRAGANENTVFSTTHNVKIEGQELEAGTYGLHLLPTEDTWTFIFSRNHTSWGSYFYDQLEDALRISVPVEEAPEIREWMSFEVLNRNRGEASIALTWGDRRATFSLSLDINQIAIDHIRKQLRSDAYWEWFSWCQAADYCAEYEINTEEALQWIDRSIEMQENFSNWDVKAKLLRQLGRQKEGDQAIARAIEMANEIYLERYGRRFLQKNDFEQAATIFYKALDKNETYWRAHFNLGNALKGLGKIQEARAAYEAALKYASADNQDRIRRAISSL